MGMQQAQIQINNKNHIIKTTIEADNYLETKASIVQLVEIIKDKET